MIDIHSHILPEVDDGSVSMSQTINMLRIAYDDGIRKIIATPNYGAGCINLDINQLESRLNKVRDEAKKINSEFQIELGNELFYSDDIMEHLRKKKALTLAGTRYVLVKFLETDEYITIKTGLHRLLIHGYWPILSNIERYECLYDNFAYIRSLTQLGAYMQINSSSIIGGILDKKTKFCKQLIAYDLIHFIASDAHSDVKRVPMLKKSYQYIEKKYGYDYAYKLFNLNVSRILLNVKLN